MSNSKHDYGALEKEYIEGPDDLTPRKMAERDGASYSAYYMQARKRGWEAKRAAFRTKVAAKSLELVTDRIAIKAAAIKDDALQVIHAAVLKMASDMTDHWVTDPVDPKHRIFVPGIVITPNDLAKLIDKLLLLTGNPTQISENRNFGIELSPDLPPDVLGLIADLAGERGTSTRSVGRASLPGARASRPD